MCFSLVFACLSVRLSVWGLYLRSLAQLLPLTSTSLPHPGNRTRNRYDPQFWWEPAGKAWVSASTLARESRVCVCVYACAHERAHVCACMYTGNLCANMYKGEGHVTEAGRWGCSGQGLPGVASSQVDSPQVSRRCDGVALRTELLGTQGPQPALLAVHMPTLDGR